MKRKFATSSGWVAIGNSADNLIQFVVFIFLARLLSTSDLGQVAFVLAFVDVLRVIASSGLAESVINNRDENPEFLSTVFWAGLLAATLLALSGVPAVFFVSHATRGIGDIYVIGALFAVLVIDVARGVHVALLRRRFNFRSIAVRSALAGLISGIIAIVLAYEGYGVWSLVWQRIIQSTLVTAQTWRAARWRPGYTMKLASLRGLLPFTAGILGSRLIDVLALRAPDLMIGSVLGQQALGLYKVGTRALDAVIQLVIKPVQFATLPALAEAHRAGKTAGAIVGLTRLTSMTIPGALLFSGVAAPNIIPLVFGVRYEASSIVMTTLSLTSVPLAISFFIGPALIAANKTTKGFYISLVQLMASVLLVYLLAQRGVGYAAMAVVLAQYATLPVVLHFLRNDLQVSLTDVARVCLPGYTSAITAFLGCAVAGNLVSSDSKVLAALTTACLFILIYSITLLLFFRDHCYSLFREMKELLSKTNDGGDGLANVL